MEKYLNTAAVRGGGDSGVSSRMFGTLLSWMATKSSPIFIVATINDLESMPPELTRKGRFDELWWVDLPLDDERKAIFKSLLKVKFKRNLADIPAEWVARSQNFTGAEIETCLQETMYELMLAEVPEANLDGQLADRLPQRLADTRPRAQADPARLAAMRQNAEKYFRRANADVLSEIDLTKRVKNGKRAITV